MNIFQVRTKQHLISIYIKSSHDLNSTANQDLTQCESQADGPPQVHVSDPHKMVTYPSMFSHLPLYQYEPYFCHAVQY